MTWTNTVRNKLLERVINRHRFNDSWIYDVYRSFRYRTFREYAKRRRLEARFYERLLNQLDRRLVFDIGANAGDKTKLFAAIADTVVSVEPSPGSLEALRGRFSRQTGVIVIPSAVGGQRGMASLLLVGGGDYCNTLSRKWADAIANSSGGTPTADQSVHVPVLTIDDLIDQYGRPCYIKIDVEGYELSAIQGLSQVVPLISFECNLPEFADETITCISILASRCPTARFNYCCTEPPVAFASSQWLSGADIAAIVRTCNLRYLEIYCRAWGV